MSRRGLAGSIARASLRRSWEHPPPEHATERGGLGGTAFAEQGAPGRRRCDALSPGARTGAIAVTAFARLQSAQARTVSQRRAPSIRAQRRPRKLPSSPERIETTCPFLRGEAGASTDREGAGGAQPREARRATTGGGRKIHVRDHRGGAAVEEGVSQAARVRERRVARAASTSARRARFTDSESGNAATRSSSMTLTATGGFRDRAAKRCANRPRVALDQSYRDMSSSDRVLGFRFIELPLRGARWASADQADPGACRLGGNNERRAWPHCGPPCRCPTRSPRRRWSPRAKPCATDMACKVTVREPVRAGPHPRRACKHLGTESPVSERE